LGKVAAAFTKHVCLELQSLKTPHSTINVVHWIYMNADDFFKTVHQIIHEHFLNQQNTQYYHERQIQLKLGIELWKRCSMEATLEYPLSIDPDGKHEYLDMYLRIPETRENIGIELKYKTMADVQTPHGKRPYVDQGAQSNGKYDFVKDVVRLERLQQDRVIHHGMAVLLTNDHRYWQPARAHAAVEVFNLNEERVLSGTLEPKWKDRSFPLNVSGSYKLYWEGADSRGGQSFRCLSVRV